MSKIAEQIAKLKEKEKQLERETRKVAFFNHILESSKKYEDKDFNDVKADVVTLLENFVKKTIEAIEVGTVVTITVGRAEDTVPAKETTPSVQPVQQAPQKQAKPVDNEMSPAAKLSFAMDHRHLAGKSVHIMNDQNIEIKGSVVGLDAPFVIVRTDTGPTIKVPIEKVSLG